MKLEINFISSS